MKEIAIVTGANRGIGLEVVRQLSKKSIQVILCSRSLEKGHQAWTEIGEPNNVIVKKLDVTSDKDIRDLKEVVKKQFGRLDILINNAGINYDTWQNAVNADLNNVHETLEANLFGPWKMVKEFLPLLKKSKSPRIVNVSSGAGALTDMTGGTPGYSISKAALNVLTIKLANDLKEENVLVNSVCPGWVRTDMGGSKAPRSVEQGAEGIVWAATIPDQGPSGKFFRDGKEIAI